MKTLGTGHGRLGCPKDAISAKLELPASSLFIVLELNGMKMESIKDAISLYFLVPCIPYAVARSLLYRQNLGHIYYATEPLLLQNRAEACSTTPSTKSAPNELEEKLRYGMTSSPAPPRAQQPARQIIPATFTTNTKHLSTDRVKEGKDEQKQKMVNYTITDLLPLPNSSVQIPRLGFGVYRSPSQQCMNSCLHALQAGYRHIDTAQFYGNEAEVGEAIRKSGIPRSEIFATTKILSPAGSPEATYSKLLASVEKVGGQGGYVDLFLIHSSKSGSSGRKQLWQALERLLEEGKTRSIGVSNFGVGHIEELKPFAKVWPPHVNQIEVSWTKAATIPGSNE